MKLTKNFKLTFALVGMILAFTFQFVILPVLKTVNIAQADTATAVTISNGTFNSSPSSYYLDSTPTGWTKISASTPTTSGVINTNDDKFSSYTETYHLSTNPQTMYVDTSDTKILMINAKNANSDYNSYSQGYTSSSISLSAHSYYYFSILAKTEVGAIASIYLNGLTDDTLVSDQTNFEAISSKVWKEYKFYIETGDNAQTITLSLYLGSKVAKSSNAVFFDNITCYQLTQTRFNSEKTNSATIKTISLAASLQPSVQNSDFETGNLTGWTEIDALPVNSVHRVINTNGAFASGSDIYTNLGSDGLSGTYALWLASKGTNNSFGYKSSDLTLERLGIYKITVNAKVDNNTTAKISIVEGNEVKDYFVNLGIDEEVYSYTPNSTSQSITSNTTNAIMNNYNSYVFYVKAQPLFDTIVHIELSLISSDENLTTISGSAIFDNITVAKISSETYQKAAESTLVKKLELTTITTNPTITNGTFNQAETVLSNNSFPAKATDWTVSLENENANVCGVVNTNQTHWDANKANYGNLSNPNNPVGFSQDTSVETNNILMMWNKESSYQSIKSSSISLSTGYNDLSFDYKKIDINSNFNVSIYNQDEVKIFEQENLPFSSWTTYHIYINADSGTSAIKIQFSLGTQTNKASGFAFVDNVNLTTLSSYTAEQFATLQQTSTQTTKTLDLSNMLFNTKLLNNGDSEESYYLAGFKGSLTSGTGDMIATAGVIENGSAYYTISPSSENTNTIKNIYYIQTNGEATYSLTSVNKATLSADTIYKFEVYMKTRLATVGDDYGKDYGATFALTGLSDAKISNIKTNNEWQKVTIIVNATTSTSVQLQLALASQNATTGFLFADNYSMATLTSDEYKTYVTEFEAKTNDNLLIIGSTDLKSDDTDDDEEETKANFNWLVIPSLLFALALIFAVLGVVLRKVSFKKFAKKKANEYDRNKTLYRDVIRKEAEQRRDTELKALNEELNSLQSEMDTIEKENHERLAAQRKTSDKKAIHEMQKEFRAYAGKHTKLQNKKDKLVDKIHEVNSAEYLLGLQKKIQIEQIKKLQNTPDTKPAEEPKEIKK